MSQSFEHQHTPPPPQGSDPIDPTVRRRTLTIVGVFFAAGFTLSAFWMSREILRVNRIERMPAEDTPPSDSGPSRPGTNKPPPSSSSR